MDRETQSWPNPGVRWDHGRRTWRTTSAAGGLEVSIMAAQCSDGMSDRTYAYAAEVKVGGEVFKGCAEKAAP